MTEILRPPTIHSAVDEALKDKNTQIIYRAAELVVSSEITKEYTPLIGNQHGNGLKLWQRSIRTSDYALGKSGFSTYRNRLVRVYEDNETTERYSHVIIAEQGGEQRIIPMCNGGRNVHAPDTPDVLEIRSINDAHRQELAEIAQKVVINVVESQLSA